MPKGMEMLGSLAEQVTALCVVFKFYLYFESWWFGHTEPKPFLNHSQAPQWTSEVHQMWMQKKKKIDLETGFRGGVYYYTIKTIFVRAVCQMKVPTVVEAQPQQKSRESMWKRGIINGTAAGNISFRAGILLGTQIPLQNRKPYIHGTTCFGLLWLREKRKRGWIVWWMHSASEIKILIKYLVLGKTKLIWDINWDRDVFMINKKVLMLTSTSRWQQYHSLHKYSPLFCNGQTKNGSLVWNRQLEREKEN